jgi:alpha-D-xyloside xylohydrolase
VYPEGTTGWRTDDLVMDFSNPEASSWYQSKISHLISQGASAIKTDFGDCIPPDAHYKNIEGRRFQNLYSLVYNAACHKARTKMNPNTAQWARSGTAGSQRYPVHWGGDSQCSWSALQGSLYATLSIGLSGFAFFSHDIGGFIGKPTPELYIRWAQLVLMSSHSRSHGAGDENGREPWFFGDKAVEIFRDFTQMR